MSAHTDFVAPAMPVATHERAAVCVCVDRACRERGREVTTVTPSAARGATGAPLRCWRCGGALVVRRIVEVR